MANFQHKAIPLGDIHRITNWEWPDAVARNATSVTIDDVGKVGLQTNDNTLFILLNTTPTWQQIITSGGSVAPSGPAGGHLTGVYPDPQVIDDSHEHTPGLTIPAYPTTLPPSGVAGGDLTGTYPNPVLASVGVTAGTYNRATVSVDAKGRVTNIVANTDPPILGGLPFPGFSNVALTGAPTAPTTLYSEDSDRIATTKYVTRGRIELPKLTAGEVLTILPGYQKTVTDSYTIESGSVLTIRGTLYVGNHEDGPPLGIEPNFTPLPNDITEDPVPPLVIPKNHFKIILSGFHVQTPIHVFGILKVI